MGLFDRFKQKKHVLYYPGCPAKFLGKDISRRHEQVLTHLGIEYVKFSELEVCCGKPCLDFGFPDEFKLLRSQNTMMFSNQGVKKIITSDPFCYFTFKKKYEGIEVEHISQTILNNIDKFEKSSLSEEITFFDSCNPHKLKELYDVPRLILEKLGYTLVELPTCRESSTCCGKAINLSSPKVAEKMSEQLLKQVKTKKLITTSPDCYLFLKKQNSNVSILELTEVIL